MRSPGWPLPVGYGTKLFSLVKRYDVRGVVHELRYRAQRKRDSSTAPLTAEAQPAVSVVCVSNRPEQLAHIVSSFDEQTWGDKELVLVTNAVPYGTESVQDRADVHVVSTDPAVSLGACLNEGFAFASGEVVARFDDDDCYAPDYLSAAVATFKDIEAHITGKAEYFAYVESQDRVVRRFPAKSMCYVGRLAGGSLVVLAAAVRDIRFPDQNLGEDVEYMRRCERAGLRLWASAPNGFLQTRSAGGTHTWDIEDRDFVTRTEQVGSGRDRSLWA